MFLVLNRINTRPGPLQNMVLRATQMQHPHVHPYYTHGHTDYTPGHSFLSFGPLRLPACGVAWQVDDKALCEPPAPRPSARAVQLGSPM